MMRPNTVVHMFGTECQMLFGEFCGGGVETFAGTCCCRLSGRSVCRSSIEGEAIETVDIVLKDSSFLDEDD
jgi:hypothetical protein